MNAKLCIVVILAGAWIGMQPVKGQVLSPRSASGSTIISRGGGGFVERRMGTDDSGRPILGTVYQAGSRQKREWRHSSRGRWHGRAVRGGGWRGSVRFGRGSHPVWRVNDAGFCYPAILSRGGFRSWPLAVNPWMGGGVTILVSF